MNRQQALDLSQKTHYLMAVQERNGVPFNRFLATELHSYCTNRMEELEDIVADFLPDRPLNKGEIKTYTPPKRQLKNSKEGLIPSVDAEKFFEDFKKEGDTWLARYGNAWFPLPYHEQVLGTVKMTLKDQGALKDYFMELGWTPTIWNHKKDASGKFIRENGKLVKTSPKFHDKGTICPNLEILGDANEIVKVAIEWLSLRNRRSVIWNEEKNTGWLAHSRLDIDGRLPSSVSGITNTHRQKHRVVANIPRVTSVLGEEMRSLFQASEGMNMVGWDASGLEARVEAHWCYKYTGGRAYAEELLEGDIHSKNAEIFGTSRDIAKNTKYALTYGSQVDTLASTMGAPKGRAQEAYDDFWAVNTALAHIFCPLTGHKLMSRSGHSLVNLVFQHTGAIIMDLAGAFMDNWLGNTEDGTYKLDGYDARRLIYYHDEYQWESDPKISDRIGSLGVESIRKAGQFLKLNVPLDAEYKIGKSWKDTH